MEVLTDFDNVVKDRLGFSLRPYQRYVAESIVGCVGEGGRFIVVSMPTGSGKTLLEMFASFYFLKACGDANVLVLEPTRFLCDQMCSKLWRKLFGDLVGREYEGECASFLHPGKRIIISTPITALKCVSTMGRRFKVLVVDEVHHAFGGRYYTELLLKLKPDIVIGFTALLPSYKKYRLSPEVEEVIGEPIILSYGFKKLVEVDSSFEPPRAIVDMFDTEMNDLENQIYEKLFCGRVEGDPRTIKFLEITLARYGKRAFCESVERAVERGKIIKPVSFEKFCVSTELSHKARTLIDILSVYDIKENEELKPVIIFTSRKATAYEFKEAITKYIRLAGGRVEVLTSDIDREERLELIRRAREKKIDVIVSTLVGEEGIDIPEAGLLIMSDISKSPLRFYQRLGRLIRIASPRKVKYLVVSLTPKTREYWDLEEALWNLYSEGVDISYIIVNVDAKGPTVKILEILDKISSIYNDIAIPYTLITQGRELSNPLNYLSNIAKNNKQFLEAIKKIFQAWGIDVDVESDEELDNALFNILTFHFLRHGSDVKRELAKLDKVISKGSFSKVLDKAIEEGRVFYIYDVDKLSTLITRELIRMYSECSLEGREYRENVFFRLDRKSILRLYTRIFPFKHVKNVKNKLCKYLEYSKRGFMDARGKEYFSVSVEHSYYNKRGKSLSPKIDIFIEVDNVRLRLLAQINYYNIAREISENSEVLELIDFNLLALGYKALEKFFEQLY